MHRAPAWGLAAVLAAGAATAADPPAKPWYARLVGGSDPKPATFADTPARPLPVGPLDPAVLTDALQAEQQAWERRLDVCLRLRELAAAANDDALYQQADDLERQATELYHARTARLGVKPALRTAAPTNPGRSRPVAAEVPTVAPPTPAAPKPGLPFKEVSLD